MFRLRKQSTIEVQTTSSLSSGNASIVKPQYNNKMEDDMKEKQQKREQHHHEVVEDDDDYNTEEMMASAIDLQAPSPKPLPDELTIESMSAVIAAAVQMSAAGGSPSSLSLGSASIIKTEKTTSPTLTSSASSPTTSTSKAKRRFSTRLFTWKRASSTQSVTTVSENDVESLPSSSLDSSLTISTTDEDDSASPRSSSASSSPTRSFPRTPDDDGRDELIYRGIQIKEIKSTLKTLVISDEVANPMPKVTLERPGFARINY